MKRDLKRSGVGISRETAENTNRYLSIKHGNVRNAMSWEIINQILGLATIDQKFARDLLKEPLATVQIRGFQLTAEEQCVFSQHAAKDLNAFSQYLMQALHHDQSDQDCNVCNIACEQQDFCED
jgi:hypothetical protein